MAKRGRKRVHTRYFDTPQEEAIVKYLSSSDDLERNQIYEEFLKDPLFKMVESIINRYQLYSLEMEVPELLNDTLGFLHTKLDKFDPSQGTKAYSYYGTVIKHRLLGKRMKEQLDLKRKQSFESNFDSIVQDLRNSYQIEQEASVMYEFFYEYLEVIDDLLLKNEEKEILKKNEEKIGYAIVHLMRNWEEVFEEGGGHKYNKNQVLECLRNMTGLSTKDIRDSLKVFKTLYFNKKKNKIDNEYNLDLE